MADAKEISQLISKSMRQPLPEQQAQQVDAHLGEDPQSQQFSDLSRVIQGSVLQAANPAPDAEQTAGPSLSAESKKRLRESVAAAAEEKLSLSQAGLISADGSGVTPAQTPDSLIPTEEVRQVASRFRLIRRLGEGGIGNVWLARDEKLNRNVAIKELNANSQNSAKAWQRFNREAEITGQLEHPNIVPIYQFGDDRLSSKPFYSMRFVGKRTLADAVTEHHDRIDAGEDGTLGLHRLLSVFLDICQAIAYAHSRGVIHRDLKPENVALDNFGQVIVLDWGLAKLTDDGELANQLSTTTDLSDSSMSRTLQGDIVGTPLYMAPEQAAGDLEHVDERTDVYGLGAILFSILTGAAPHKRSADGVNANQLGDVLKSIAEGETPQARDVRGNVPSELEAICAKAMARKPHLRFPSVQSLADSIESWMAGQSEKQAGYETLRMEGRELRADLQSTVSDLERNVRFMSKLPPIQQLIRADMDLAEWRSRLTTIFEGLLEANSAYRSVAYSQVRSEQTIELARVERHGRDFHRLRIVPRSRLQESPNSPFVSSVVNQQLDDVVTSLVCTPPAENASSVDPTIGLVAGIPVYDEQTEEVFGIVTIEANIDLILRRQMDRRMTAEEVIISCDVPHVLLHKRSSHLEEESFGKNVREFAPYFAPAIDGLQHKLEFIDEADAEIYGARIWLVAQQHGLMYLLKRQKPKGRHS